MGYTIDGINTNTDMILQSDIENIQEGFDDDPLKKTFEDICLYTLYRNNFFISFYLRNKFKNFSFNKEDKTNEYLDDDHSFTFYLLSDHIDNKKKKRELTSLNRYGKCHFASLCLLFSSPYDESYALTGYINNGEKDILHSIVETVDEDGKCIIDYTQNLVMNKEDYLKLTGFKEITRISKEELNKDLFLLKELDINSRFYLLFRHEIVRSLKKNSKILKLED